jgi:serine protease
MRTEDPWRYAWGGQRLDLFSNYFTARRIVSDFQRVTRPIDLLAIGFALAAGSTASHAARSPQSDAFPPTSDQVVARFVDGTPGAQAEDEQTLAQLHAAAARAGVQFRVARRTWNNALVLKLDRHMPVNELQVLAREIRESDATVQLAEPDRIKRTAFKPDDTLYPRQWNYFEKRSINLPTAWNLTSGAGAIVAVLDTGYRPHADLMANIVGGYDFISDADRARDGGGRDSVALDAGDWTNAGDCGVGAPATNSSWHGTMVAGVIAAVANNALGVAGVAYGAKILPVRVLGKCGGYDSDIADGIVWAAGGTVAGAPPNAYPANVLNLSMSGLGACSATYQAAINAARDRGATVVAAAGDNNRSNAAGYSPGNCDGVITVGSVDRIYGHGLTKNSNYGLNVQLSAPGGSFDEVMNGGILSTSNDGVHAPGSNDTYTYGEGTSLAAAHVSGVAALMLSRNMAMSPDQVLARMRANAQPFEDYGYTPPYFECSYCGAGVVDAYWSAFMATSTLVPDLYETNSSFDTAQPILPPSATVTGTFANNFGEGRWYKVTLAPGRQLRVSAAPLSNGHGLSLHGFSLQLFDQYLNLKRSPERNFGTQQFRFTNTEASATNLYIHIFNGYGAFSISISH